MSAFYMFLTFAIYDTDAEHQKFYSFIQVFSEFSYSGIESHSDSRQLISGNVNESNDCSSTASKIFQPYEVIYWQ